MKVSVDELLGLKKRKQNRNRNILQIRHCYDNKQYSCF